MYIPLSGGEYSFVEDSVVGYSVVEKYVVRDSVVGDSEELLVDLVDL